MKISRSIDVEETIRAILSEYLNAYCKPIPADFSTPCILITASSGSSESTNTGKGKVDSFTVVLDSRDELAETAMEYLRNALAVLEASTGTDIAHVATNSLYYWGSDPVRPDLSMYSATLRVTAHREELDIDQIGG